MLKNLYKEKEILLPSIAKEYLKDKFKSEYDDEKILSLCEDFAFDNMYHFILSHLEFCEYIKRLFSCIRYELEYLDPLLKDDEISEIMVNGIDAIFIEKKGIISKLSFTLDSKAQLKGIIQRLASKLGREMNDLNPILDARLSDGSRINAVNDNIAINGPILTIRKFSNKMLSMEDLIMNESITKEASEFIKKLVISAYNIFVSGGTSSGKTSFLNIISAYIPENERIIVIEDSSELKIQAHENLIRMETKSSNVQGKGEVSASMLLKASLRMRPDRIIVGEVRGDEVIDMLAAMSTGHDGSLSTGHANSPMAMLRRLETLHIAKSGFPVKVVREQIADSIEIIVQLKRFSNGQRKIIEISEVIGVINDEIVLNPLFTYSKDKGLTRTQNELKNKEKYIGLFTL